MNQYTEDGTMDHIPFRVINGQQPDKIVLLNTDDRIVFDPIIYVPPARKPSSLAQWFPGLFWMLMAAAIAVGAYTIGEWQGYKNSQINSGRWKVMDQ